MKFEPWVVQFSTWDTDTETGGSSPFNVKARVTYDTSLANNYVVRREQSLPFYFEQQHTP